MANMRLAARGTTRVRRSLATSRGLIITTVALALASLAARPCEAATFNVDRTDDAPAATACTAAANDCSLRGAVTAANALPNEPSTITVPAGTFVLSQAVDCSFRKTGCGTVGCDYTTHVTSLCISAPITLQGDSAATTIIDGSQLGSVAVVSGLVAAELRDLTLTHGRQLNRDYGGGGVDNYGTLTLTRTIVHANSAQIGGGVKTEGPLNIVQSTISANFIESSGFGEAAGVFVDEDATATIVQSAIVDNTADLHGGGLDVFNGSATVRDSTISGNKATTGRGGGIQTFNTTAKPVTLVVTNSTISDNHSGGSGAGIDVNPSVTARLQSVTIAGNTAGASGGGIRIESSSSTTIRNSLIAGNNVLTPAVAPDCSTNPQGSPSLKSEGYNLIGDASFCAISGDTTGNQLGVDPLLAPLADNGGPTQTRALLPNSPAIDAGNPAGCTDDDEVPLAHDQRGFARVVDGNGDSTARCDLGAVEQSASGEVAVTSVQPGRAGNAGTTLVVVHGSGFDAATTIKLVRSGEADVVGTDTVVGEGGLVALTRFDLTGKALGDWQLVVSAAATTPTFTIETARGPQLWVDIVGRPQLRTKRLVRYLVEYGNSGNTDALAVPLLFAFPETITAIPQFDIAPPPRQFGKTTLLEWGQYYTEIVAGDGPPLANLILLVPIVPAGFSGVLEVIVSADKVGTPFTLRAEIADPLVDNDGPKADVVAKLVAGAHDKSADVFKYTLPTTIDPDLTDYMTTELQTVVDQGVQSLLASSGGTPQVYSLTQLGFDLASFGLVWAELHPPTTVAVQSLSRPWADVPGLLAAMSRTVADVCGPAPVEAQLQCVCGEGPCGTVCCEGCSCPKCGDGGPPKPKPSCLARPGDSDCKRPTTPFECREIGFQVIRGNNKAGEKIALCTNNPLCVVPNPMSAPSGCIHFDITPVGSSDPNDKSGTAGAGDAHFVTDQIPLQYAIQFENKPDATAPAQEVVVTDQLDPALVDLATLSLGPIGFGKTHVAPPPGATTFHHDVDLRPDTNLIVRIDAALDPATAILSWHFSSLDPATMQPPEDPLTGFLPPNVTPPAGDGIVGFTVDAKPGLATGTTIANQARIVFDDNAPIDTPIWSNTIDVSPPVSAITSAATAGACAQSVNVTWSGTDQGAGIGAYRILASENGGPLVERLVTDQTSGNIPAKWGASYAFQSVAEDLAGNSEAAPAAPGAPVVLPDCGPFDLAVTKVAAKGAKLTAKKPAVTVPVKVEIQNRSAQSETIADETVLAKLVHLTVEPLLSSCPSPTATLHAGKPQKPLPLVLGSKKKLMVVFDVTIDCAVDHAKGDGHEDFRLIATIDQSVLGGSDAHPADDVCPRPGAKKPVQDPFPDGKIAENGCGPKNDDGLPGGDILIDVQAP